MLNKNFEFLLNPPTNLLVLQGGSSSGKTYSILQTLIVNCIRGKYKDKTIDVIRRTFPALRISAMKDFEDILKNWGLYSLSMHNKSNHEYLLPNNNKFRFYSADNEEKMRGPRRDIAYFNEVLEFKMMDVTQVLLRTKELKIMDYNPSDEFHWVYEHILSREDVTFNKSTYKDNPFMNQETRKEIERLKEVDENLWKVYGLGERGSNKGLIYPSWDYYDAEYKDFEGVELFGADFGYNNPSALIRMKYNEHTDTLLIDELLYENGLTTSLFIKKLDELREQGLISYDDQVTADSSRPEVIEEINQAGYNFQSSIKGKNSVIDGINFLKSKKKLVTKTSVNAVKEFRSYKWKENKDGIPTDSVPLDFRDHLMDALRYAVESLRRGDGFFVESADIGNQKNIPSWR